LPKITITAAVYSQTPRRGLGIHAPVSREFEPEIMIGVLLERIKIDILII
jgi:hypothetical protein